MRRSARGNPAPELEVPTAPSDFHGPGSRAMGAYCSDFKRARREKVLPRELCSDISSPRVERLSKVYQGCPFDTGPDDPPITSSASMGYSLPVASLELESSCNASAAIRPSRSRWMSTVVSEGLLYSARRVLSKPVTETSSGTRHPRCSNPLITPMAVRSFTATTAVGRGL